MNNYPWLDAYLLEKPGVHRDYKAEWGWQRYLLSGKMFAAICTPGAEHEIHRGRTMVILKCEPTLAALLREKYADIVPGFYCNKEHWNSVYLDGTIPEDLMRSMCDASYKLIFDKLPKKLQKEIKE